MRTLLAHVPGTAALAAIAAGAAVLLWRVRESTKPVSARSILIPPIGMSTGFLMLLAPAVRVPWLWGVFALAAGALLLAYPLTHTSHLERRNDAIMMRRSRTFVGVMVGLVILRIALHPYVATLASPQQTVTLFFMLAFGMILRWRVQLFFQYRKLCAPSSSDAAVWC